MKIELAKSTFFARLKFEDKIRILIFYIYFSLITILCDAELKAMDTTKDGCCIMSDEHFRHLFNLLSSISSGILKPLATLLIFDVTILFLSFVLVTS